MTKRGNNVPENTIAVYFKDDSNMVDERLDNIISKPNEKREWFPSSFYKYNPLVVGNTYGFIITTEYDFTVYWNGGENPNDIKIRIHDQRAAQFGYPTITSSLGLGIFTIKTPFFIKTPPNVNIMTINPPNYILPLSTVMCSVIQGDSLKENLTFDIKVHVPDAEITFPAGHPIAAFIPIPRNYADNFELTLATEIFNEKEIKEEIQKFQDLDNKKVDLNKYNKEYMGGENTYGNRLNNNQI